jgi:hypothetical protein
MLERVLPILARPHNYARQYYRPECREYDRRTYFHTKPNRTRMISTLCTQLLKSYQKYNFRTVIDGLIINGNAQRAHISVEQR